MLITFASLSICNEEEKRGVIRFLWYEGVPGAENYRRPSVQYGDNFLRKISVHNWIDQFKAGCTSVLHQEGAGCS